MASFFTALQVYVHPDPERYKLPLGEGGKADLSQDTNTEISAPWYFYFAANKMGWLNLRGRIGI